MAERGEVRYFHYKGKYSADNWPDLGQQHLEAAVRMLYGDMAYAAVLPIGHIQRKVSYLAWQDITGERVVGRLTDADTVRVEMRVPVKPLKIEDM